MCNDNIIIIASMKEEKAEKEEKEQKNIDKELETVR